MQVIDLPDPVIAPRSLGFSPDGRFLAVWEQKQLCLIDTVAGSAQLIWSGGRQFGYCTPGVGFTANGRSVIAHHVLPDGSSLDKTLQIHDTKAGEPTRKDVGMNVWSLDVGTNGLVVLAGWSAKQSLRVEFWDTRTDKQRLAVKWPRGFPQVLAVSADGKWLAGSCVDLIRLWNFTTNETPTRARRQFKVTHNETVRAMAVAPKGEFVAATADRLYIWDVKTGKEVPVAATVPDWGREDAFHSSQALLAFSSGEEVALWSPGEKVSRFAWGIGRVQAVTFTPDGLRCAAAGQGKVVVWDVDV